MRFLAGAGAGARAAAFTAAAALVLAATLSGCASPGPVAAASPVLRLDTPAASVNPCKATAAYAAEVTDAGRLGWRTPLPPGQADGVPTPEVIGGVAVFGGDHDLTGLRAASGRRLWDIHLAGGDGFDPDFRYLWQWHGNVIALGGPSSRSLRLVSVDAASGRVRWRLRLGANVEAIPVLGPGGLLALQAGRTVETVSLATGRPLWSRTFVQPDQDGNYVVSIAITDGVVLADYIKSAPPGPGRLGGFDATTGRQLWTRGGVPLAPALAAAGGIAYLSGGEPGSAPRGAPLTAVAATTGQVQWSQSSVPFVIALQATPHQVLYGAQDMIWDVNPRTGALRWKVAGHLEESLITASRLLYVEADGVTSLRLRDGTTAWRRNVDVGNTTFLAAPRGPNLLVGAGNSFDDPPGTRVYVLNRETGKTAAAPVRLPSDLPAAPAVSGRDAIYQLTPQFCESA